RLLGDSEHATVDVRRDARDHRLRHLAEPALGPVAADHLEVVADAAGADDDRLRPQLELPDPLARGSASPLELLAGLEHRAANAGDGTVLDHQLVHLMAKGELDLAAPLAREHRLEEHPHQLRPRSPGAVE